MRLSDAPRNSIDDDFVNRTMTALARQKEICYRPESVCRDTLHDLLDQARSTSFGRGHGLGSVSTLDDWKRAIPIRNYEDFRPYVEKQLAGESYVLTRSAPYAFLRTSGSSGMPKYIPTTRHWRDQYRGRGLYAQWGLYFEQMGLQKPPVEILLDLSWERTPASRGDHGFPIYSISRRPAAVGVEDWVPPWYDASWLQGDDTEEYADSLYRKLRLLVESDIRLIVTLNPSKIVGLAEQLASRGAQLIDDVGAGTLRGFPTNVPANPALARELTRTLRSRPDGFKLTDLWSNLSLIVCWNSASAGLYRDWLEEVSPGIRKLPFSTTGTEGIVTIPVDEHPSAGPLAVDQGVFEFVPYLPGDDGGPLDGAAPTLDFHELETDQSYRLVMSQANGLYRYDVGDVYTVVDWVGFVPRLEFSGRAGFGSSFTGEKLTESHVYAAVYEACANVGGGGVPMFTCIPRWGNPPGYVLAVEQRPGLGSSRSDTFVDAVEAALQQGNPEYADKRRTGRLHAVRLLPLQPNSFSAIAEAQRRNGAAAMQIKHHWLQRNDDFLNLIDELGLDLESEPHRV